ncbi:M24 family metallopeptidase [Campylobacter gastrosuis]|uniref:Aminopeptidase P family protein n=1 Tax=Campylobacter gastrosuis TaxID=2974576 RepID=A0ABT7HPG5_9BACT|nr:M24 family metallopeptidase [Campylobacter gastrosuis]MDL0088518.1 aminopeptidase P family protein [Campylobacter gastrosuis]
MKNYILRGENAVFFECGYSCDNEIFICLDGVKFFITDARYATEAKELINADVSVICSNNLIKDARAILRRFAPKIVVFDPNDFSVSAFNALTYRLRIHFLAKPDFSKQKRIIKSQSELEILKQAAKFGASCFDEFADFLRKNGEGKSEKELHFYATQIFKQKNALNLSFEPILAINENAAKAHALPSDKILRYGDLVLLDAGVKFKRYCSDRTRTACFDENFSFDKTQNFKDKKQQEIYNIVLNAQKAAINAVKIGVKAKDIDNAAREVIAKSGYGEFFIHSTGHGVGVDIHELPNINQKSEVVLEKGMVFSVEPGIYLPNELGVRIEDVVVVGENGAEIL